MEVFCSVAYGKVDVSIKDYGRGMLESEINSINSFRKFGTESFREKGLGIGLEIVKKIAALYEIDFSIQSSKNIFTVSKLNLPLFSPN